MTTMALTAFPGAPPGSYVSEEGWLIVDQEAWTIAEWNLTWHRSFRPSARPTGRPPIYTTAEERLEAKRRQSREQARRRRQALP